MRVLVACEFSNTVRDAFLARGHDAYSCDLIRADHPNPNWRRHIQGDVRPLLRERWDLIIAHPPCTYLCNSGVHLLRKEDGRGQNMIDGLMFFMECLEANASKVCVENPIMHGFASKWIDKPSQIIQPYHFGHPESKATCLWLKGLPKLIPTNNLNGSDRGTRQWINQTSSGQNKVGGKRRAKIRARTYEGIAQAMAEQWG